MLRSYLIGFDCWNKISKFFIPQMADDKLQASVKTVDEKTIINKELDTKENTEISSTPSVTETNTKKSCPFLTKTDSKDNKTVCEENESSTAKKQHEIIDNLSKNNTIFNGIGKLYFFSKKTGKPETRGEGKFLILKDESELHRLVMIRDQVMLKGCNHYILPSCPLTKATKAKNGWTWTALADKSDAEKNEDSTVYFAIFKDEETSTLFEKSYNKAIDLNDVILKSKKTASK